MVSTVTELQKNKQMLEILLTKNKFINIQQSQNKYKTFFIDFKFDHFSKKYLTLLVN